MNIVHNDGGSMIIKEDMKEPCHVYDIPKKESEDSILVVKVGSDERPATESDLKGIQEMLTMAMNDKDLTIVTHHCIEFYTIPRSCLGGNLVMAIGSGNMVKKIDGQGGK
jgi:hypothetical protein